MNVQDAIANKDDVEKISPLDVRQVLEDYAYAIPLIKAKLKLRPSAPVISFGGSYGGMLTTWFAEKYPHLLAGYVERRLSSENRIQL